MNVTTLAQANHLEKVRHVHACYHGGSLYI